MPWFVLIGRDAAGSGALRQQHRPAHLGKLQTLDAAGRIRHGGPLLGEAGEPEGSVVVFEAASLSEARQIGARDPYVVEGVFEGYEIFETKPVFPRDATD